MCISRRHAVRWMGCAWPVGAQTQHSRVFIFLHGVPFGSEDPLFRMFAEVARQRQWSRSASSSSCTSQISESRNIPGADASMSDASMSELASSDGSDVATTDIRECREARVASSRRSFSCSPCCQSGKHDDDDRTCVQFLAHQ